jgi:hypothetical protein
MDKKNKYYGVQVCNGGLDKLWSEVFMAYFRNWYYNFHKLGEKCY